MSDKSLADKAIQIQGKDYVLVSDRIIYFNKNYPNGSISTELVTEPTSDIVVVKATIIPDNKVMYTDKVQSQMIDHVELVRKFTGYSQAVKGAGFINKTAALENAETSAVGRALAMMGIGVIDSIASVDEINKAKGTDADVAKAKQKLFTAFKEKGITDSEIMMDKIQLAVGKDLVETVGDVAKVIKLLDNES